MKQIPLWSLVEIEWIDSCHTSGWVRPSRIDWDDQASSLLHKTTGYLLRQTKDYVSVVQSYQDNWAEKMPESVDALMTIPAVSVKKITLLKKAQSR